MDLSCLFHWHGGGNQTRISVSAAWWVMGLTIATAIQECGLCQTDFIPAPPFGWLTFACCSQMNSRYTALELSKTLFMPFEWMFLSCVVLSSLKCTYGNCLWDFASAMRLIFPLMSYAEISHSLRSCCQLNVGIRPQNESLPNVCPCCSKSVL